MSTLSPTAITTHARSPKVGSPWKLQDTCLGKVSTYAAFMLVGTASGWLLVSCIYQFPANYTDVSKMFPGPSAIINGTTGLSVSLIFAVYNIWHPEGLSMRTAQLGVACLCSLSVIGQVMLAGWWQVGQADLTFPIIFIVFAMGNIVANMTYFVMFPLITIHYGGWLIAPVRAGTDLSGFITAVLGQAQAPSGGTGQHTFPIAYMSVGFAILAAAGLATWVMIVYTGLGLREHDDALAGDAEKGDSSQRDGTGEPHVAEEEASSDVASQGYAAMFKNIFRGFICPCSLALPVALATLSQVNYWTLGANSYNIASQMLNAPGNCDGDFGANALRIATTLNFALTPVGSVLSSLGRCPRSLFYCIFILQSLCALALILCLFGAGRETFWMTEAGRVVYVAACGLVGMLEGYLLTMAYRYCGDDDGVPVELRDSASKLLSLLGVVAVNIPNIFIGVLLSNGTIECH